MTAALEVIKVHYPVAFVAFCTIGSTAGIMSFIWLMWGIKK